MLPTRSFTFQIFITGSKPSVYSSRSSEESKKRNPSDKETPAIQRRGLFYFDNDEGLAFSRLQIAGLTGRPPPVPASDHRCQTSWQPVSGWDRTARTYVPRRRVLRGTRNIHFLLAWRWRFCRQL